MSSSSSGPHSVVVSVNPFSTFVADEAVRRRHQVMWVNGLSSSFFSRTFSVRVFRTDVVIMMLYSFFEERNVLLLSILWCVSLLPLLTSCLSASVISLPSCSFRVWRYTYNPSKCVMHPFKYPLPSSSLSFDISFYSCCPEISEACLRRHLLLPLLPFSCLCPHTLLIRFSFCNIKLLTQSMRHHVLFGIFLSTKN